MQTQEILKKAMSNRKPISFQYHRIGKDQQESVGSARVILISTDNFGKETVMIDLFSTQNKFKNSMPSWRYFDMNDMCNIQILSN